MKKLLFVLVLLLVIGCSSQPSPTPETPKETQVSETQTSPGTETGTETETIETKPVETTPVETATSGVDGYPGLNMDMYFQPDFSKIKADDILKMYQFLGDFNKLSLPTKSSRFSINFQAREKDEIGQGNEYRLLLTQFAESEHEGLGNVYAYQYLNKNTRKLNIDDFMSLLTVWSN